MYIDLLKKQIKNGILHLHLPNGGEYTFGQQGLEAHWNIKDENAIRSIAKDWEFELGETYIQGKWDAGSTGLRNLLAVLRENFATYRLNRWLLPFGELLKEWNKVKRSYANVSHHYDVPEPV